MNFVRFAVLPILLAGASIFNFVIESWAVGAVMGIFLVYYLIVVRAEYAAAGRLGARSWLEQVTEALILPSRLRLALLAAGASIIVAAFAFGLTVGVGVGIGIWLVLFGLWVAAVRKRSRRGRE